MGARAYWKGYLKLSLVSCPVAVYSATNSDTKVTFRQVNSETGNRLKQQMIDSVTGEVVEGEQKAKGYEVGKDQFVIVTDDELKDLQVEANKTIEISTFVPRDQIDAHFIDNVYYTETSGKRRSR